MSFPLPVPDELRSLLKPGSGVLLGISGGVDSSVALALLKHLDCDVHCVTFKNFCSSDGRYGGEANRSCCSDEAIREAAITAARFESRHMVGNVEEVFHKRVISPFVDQYLGGKTPNPCVNCNTGVRFPRLAELADLKGLEFVATGHYARMVREQGQSRLYRGMDSVKDQAYFLHGLSTPILERTVFPLGWYTKPDVRRAAEALGLSSARKPDSQEICFVPDDDRTFLFEGVGGRIGDIVDLDGRVLGEHRGLEFYTIGQRRGLGISAAEPLYVVELQTAANRVVLGPRPALAVTHIECAAFRTLDGGDAVIADPAVELVAQVRHRHGGAPVGAVDIDGDRCTVDLDRAIEGVAPGQFLVLFTVDPLGERVVGGGRIISTYLERGADHGESQ